MELSPSQSFGSTSSRSLQQDLFLDLLRQFGAAKLSLTGASMLPTIWPGDVVMVGAKKLSELRAGEVVLAARDGKFIAHRIKSLDGDRLVTQGDSMPQCDAPFTASEILGQVVSILRDGHNVSLEQSLWQRAISSIVRRSDFCQRMTLRIGRRWHRLLGMELLWAK